MASLGFVLSDGPAEESLDIGGRTLRVVGHIHSPGEFVVGEDEADASIWVADVSQRLVHRLNRNRAATEAFLTAFDEYVRDGRPADAATMLTAEQAAERLALLRAGRVTPRPAARETIPHEVRVRRLLARLNEIEPDAVSSSWWAGVIEQARDGVV